MQLKSYIQGLHILVIIARSFAYGIANLDDSRGERSKFASLLANRLLNAVLRSDFFVIPPERRSSFHQTVTFFCKRVSNYVDIPLLQALPALFFNPWMSDEMSLILIMQGRREKAGATAIRRELGEVAEARLNVLNECGRFSEAANLARWYFEGGATASSCSSIDLFRMYVDALLRARCFEKAVDVLIQNKDQWSRDSIAQWVQRIIEAGSPSHAEIFLQMLSSSYRNRRAP